MTHLIETNPVDFRNIKCGLKTFLVVKKESRDYSPNDTLIIQGYEKDKDEKISELPYTIDYIENGATSGLSKNFCILGIKEKENP